MDATVGAGIADPQLLANRALKASPKVDRRNAGQEATHFGQHLVDAWAA